MKILRSFNTDLDIWQDFKSQCAKQGKDMGSVLTEFMKNYIRGVET